MVNTLSHPSNKTLVAVQWRKWLAIAICTAVALAGVCSTASAQGSPPEMLRARYAALSGKLESNQFHRPLYLESEETPDSLRGDIYATVNYPFATVDTALNNPKHWCDVLILHLNIKYCKPDADTAAPTILVNLGKKSQQALPDTYEVAFKYRAEASASDYFAVALSAAKGPLNTSDYRIHLEAVAVDPTHTFLHLNYSYTYGLAGKLAMKAYLATIGNDKVGFTRRNGADGKSDYVDGVRGVVERNTMRYYLAIDSYLSAVNAPPSAQFEQRIQSWFDATERYARQLHELDRGAYVDMKRAEYRRQNTVQ
ncbi:MAG: putative signal peptide protein [Herbaspirillum sp.]|nr:putative signal peptide protein [Herbaspirillum sp.]